MSTPAELLLNIGTIIALSFSTLGIFTQILRVKKRRSAEDISITEVTLRTIAGIIVWGKIFIVHDVFLAIGASLLTLIMVVYFFTLLGYYPRQRYKCGSIVIAAVVSIVILTQWRGSLLLSLGSLAACGFFVWGITTQTIKVIRRKSSDDISLVDVSLRMLNNVVLLVKYISIHDRYLIAGGILVIAFIAFYLPTVIFFRLKKNN